ncbi:MAG: 4Fe-4S binding protein [Eggerthellaceae bacterium]|nr:4Fe-4S binding protein [Eggerthellaceae bacterium]
MALRKIITIDDELCIGCRLCVDACHEGAIGMVDGKAKLLRDDYCDGLGDCLPACPTGAITFEEREAQDYDEQAVIAHLAARDKAMNKAEDNVDRIIEETRLVSGCPGSRAVELGGGLGAHAAFTKEREASNPVEYATTGAPASAKDDAAIQSQAADKEVGFFGGAPIEAPSRLMQWPAQIKLVPVSAPYYNGRGLLIAADCTAFAYSSFHERFMKGRVTIIGCPKLDAGSYTDKLSAIISSNDITDVTVARMEVPCCGGIERAAAEALRLSGKDLPYNVVTFKVTGEIIPS